MVLRPTLCLRGGLPGAKKSPDEDWSQESEEYDDNNNAQVGPPSSVLSFTCKADKPSLGAIP